MESSNRVILNTGFLYLNMLVTMVVQLISVRILLHAMGKIDYGIYNVVAGIVALFAFMNVAMAASTQRFLSFSIGQNDKENLKELFYQSVVLHLAIGLVVLLVLEIGGGFYVHHIMSAPQERIKAATLLLNCIAASTFVNIITVPYEADINANENMGAIAVINIMDSLMKLGSAFFVLYTTWDKLIVFGVLTMTSLIITLVLKRVYCIIRYPESHIQWHRIRDYSQMRELGSFAMWNLIGSGCSIARYQGTAMVLNYFFGIIVNAAYGVAQQVNGLLNFFANTIVRAIRPQIVKSEGSGEHERMLRLSETTCRITSLMVAFLAIPLTIEMEFILQIWLGEVPSPECVMFCRCFLVIVFINQLTIGLQIAIESVGKIKLLQSTVGFMHLTALPLGCLCYWLGCPVQSIMLCIIGEEVVALFARMAIAKKLTGLKPIQFFKRTIIPCIVAVLSVAYIGWISFMKVDFRPWGQCFATFALTISLLAMLSYTLILTREERIAIKKFCNLILVHLHLGK